MILINFKRLGCLCLSSLLLTQLIKAMNLSLTSLCTVQNCRGNSNLPDGISFVFVVLVFWSRLGARRLSAKLKADP